MCPHVRRTKRKRGRRGFIEGKEKLCKTLLEVKTYVFAQPKGRQPL